MSASINRYGQPIGQPVPEWVPRPLPPLTPISGLYCRLEHVDPSVHGEALFRGYADAPDDSAWTYLPVERAPELSAYLAWLGAAAASRDPLFHAIIDLETGKARGVAAYLRIDAANGVIEVGHINLAPGLQRTRAATEAIFLLMRRAFDELGYRRFEWKCDSLNAPSRRAALRLGFTYEGLFRQAVVYKGRNRDTAWYSIIDSEWPAARLAFERWLAPDNFDGSGRQRASLGDLRDERRT